MAHAHHQQLREQQHHEHGTAQQYPKYTNHANYYAQRRETPQNPDFHELRQSQGHNLPYAQTPIDHVHAAASALHHQAQDPHHPTVAVGDYHVAPPPPMIRNAPPVDPIEHAHQAAAASMTVPTSLMSVYTAVPHHIRMHQPEEFRAMGIKLIDSPISAVRWAVKRDSRTGVYQQHVVFAISSSGQLYRSADAGHTWENQSPLLNGNHVLSVHVSRADPAYITVVTKTPATYFSSDGGETYHEHQLHIVDVRLHPTHPDWLLASTQSRGCGRGGTKAEHDASEDGPELDSKLNCFYRLHISRDHGQTFTQIYTHVMQFDWAPNHGLPNDHGHYPQTENTIFVATYTDDDPTVVHDRWDKNVHFVQTRDDFKTIETIIEHGNRFFIGHGYVFVAAVNPEDEAEVNLWVRYNGTSGNVDDLEWQLAHLPVDSLPQHSYTILDSSENQAFVLVNHAPIGEGAETGHLYTSDMSGSMFSLSLANVHRTPDGHAAFAKVEGLEGIFMANFVPHESVTSSYEEAASLIEEDSMGQADAGSESQLSAPKKVVRAQTSITFNKGADWYHLDPPTKDCNGEPIICEPLNGQPCRLHLHGIASGRFGPFYSDERAPGLIIANGNIGHYIDSHRANTYLSRDGGLTWIEVMKGSHIYEVGDQGGLIVMASDSELTDVLYFSWDEGATWDGVKMSSQPFLVENIIIEPDNSNVQFVVYGYHPDSNAGVVTYVDFGELHTRMCNTNVMSADSDFELWSPHDSRMEGQCLMGRRFAITRRKQNAKCFIPPSHTPTRFYENCPCTIHDFTCDYGFTRDPNTNRCIPDGTGHKYKSLSSILDSMKCSGTYLATKGYRKVPGNTCVGGSQWEPDRRPCPSRIGFFTVLLLLAIVVGVCFAVVSIHQKQDIGDLVLQVVDYCQGKKQFSFVGASNAMLINTNRANEGDTALDLSDDEFKSTGVGMRSSLDESSTSEDSDAYRTLRTGAMRLEADAAAASRATAAAAAAPDAVAAVMAAMPAPPADNN